MNVAEVWVPANRYIYDVNNWTKFYWSMVVESIVTVVYNHKIVKITAFGKKYLLWNVGISVYFPEESINLDIESGRLYI